MNRQAKREDETWRGEDLASNHGRPSAVICLSPKCPPGGDARGSRIGAVLKASAGCCGPAPRGVNCPGEMAAPVPVGVGSTTGKKRACCSSAGAPAWPNSTTSKRSGGMSALPMAAFCPPKKGGQGRQDHAGQGHNVDGAGRWHGDLRWEQSLDAASPAEVTRLEQPLDTVAVSRPGQPGRPRKRPDRWRADRGYDSNPWRARLAHRGIEPIIPARRQHRRATHQDGRQWRRDRRRWMVERTFAWLGHFRRLVVRDERLITVDTGFSHLAWALLT
jgi:transposase